MFYRNPGMKCIEGDLIKALLDVGVIPQDHHDNVQKVTVRINIKFIYSKSAGMAMHYFHVTLLIHTHYSFIHTIHSYMTCY